jgi:CubicO group peptidase (beta-lactamase class C family)
MPLRRTTRGVILLLGVSITSALGYAAYVLYRLAPIGTAYAAKTLCSGVFISRRAVDDIVREDIRADNHPLLRAIDASVDRSRQSASASMLGMARRDAIFRAGEGCALTLSSELPPRAAEAPAETDPPVSADTFAADRDASVDRARLQHAIDSAFSEPNPEKLQRTRAVVVLHRGNLLSERYAAGFSAQTPMLGWSMTKSVAAALIGILVREGKLAPERNALLPQWRSVGDPRSAITLDHLLRMVSGMRFRESHSDPLEDAALMLFASRDMSGYAIDKPLEVPPGTRWSYSSGTSNILAAIMRQAIGGSEADYHAFPRRALFEPIGMRTAVLELDASGTFVTSSYMYASPHDWARFGQLLLQDGIWNGRRILPEGWVKYMSTLTPQSTRHDFGAHLWIKVPPPFDTVAQPLPELPADMFHVVGHEGQFVTVIPSRQLVVVRLGLSHGQHVWDHGAFISKVLAAVPQ